MNRITFDRVTWGGSSDVVVPVIDGVPLTDRFEDRELGLAAALVVTHPEQWLGAPRDVEGGRPVILDGTCGDAGCCGVVAEITIGPDTVRWHDFEANGNPPIPDGLDSTFDPGRVRVGARGTPHHDATPDPAGRGRVAHLHVHAFVELSVVSADNSTNAGENDGSGQ